MVLYEPATPISFMVRVNMKDHAEFMHSVGGTWRKNGEFWFVPRTKETELKAYLTEKFPGEVQTEPANMDEQKQKRKYTKKSNVVVEPIVEPVDEPTVEPVDESIAEPVVETKPARKYTKKTKQITEPAVEHDTETVVDTKPARKYTKKAKSVAEPVVEPVVETKPMRKYTKKVKTDVDSSTGATRKYTKQKKNVEEVRVEQQPINEDRVEDEVHVDQPTINEQQPTNRYTEVIDEPPYTEEILKPKEVVEKHEYRQRYHPRQVIDTKKQKTYNDRRDFINKYINSDSEGEEETDEDKQIYEKFKGLFQYYRTFSEKPKENTDFNVVLERIKAKLKILE
jgi:hypothetical protein